MSQGICGAASRGCPPVPPSTFPGLSRPRPPRHQHRPPALPPTTYAGTSHLNPPHRRVLKANHAKITKGTTGV